MSREQKAQMIDALQEEFDRCTIGILTDYRGLSNAQITALRRRVQESDGAYRVVKNTLARFAAERAQRADLAGSFEGPTAIAFGYGEVTGVAKALVQYVRGAGVAVAIRGGFVPEGMLSAKEVNDLAMLPPREVLVAMVIGGMKSPLRALVGCLSSPLRGLAGVLQARIQQLEEGQND